MPVSDHSAATAWRPFIWCLVGFVPGVLILGHFVAIRAWNSNFELGPVLAFLLIIQLFVILAIRPRSRQGRVATALSSSPLAGLALTGLSRVCCPGGHPPLEGLVWALTGVLTVFVDFGALLALASAARRGESSLFVCAEMGYIVLSAAVATALLPHPF